MIFECANVADLWQLKSESAMSNQFKKRQNIVYSTNPDFQYESNEQESQETLPNQQQNLRVQLDKKQRAGKQVTLISGFIGTDDDLKSLEKQLKNHCGTGGSSKNGEIIIQGDNRKKVQDWLVSQGYKSKLAGG